MRKIITSGSAYTDIDVLACSVALQELFERLGEQAIAVIVAPFNETIPTSVRNWNFELQNTKPEIQPNDRFIIVDVSEPKYFEKFVSLEKTIQVFDHHFGYELFWEKRLGGHAIIQHVGSCATLIWNEFKQKKMAEHISGVTANLLYTAIFANTLNLKASVTSDADIIALDELRPYTSLPEEWIATYYSEIELCFLNDVTGSVSSDVKRVEFSNVNYTIGQVELWDTSSFLAKPDLLEQIKIGLDIELSSPDHWFLIVSDIQNGNTRLLTDNAGSKKLISSFININFQENIGISNKLWMRKEILREIRRIHNDCS